MSSNSYLPIEQMICAASRLLEDGSLVVVGTGAPCAAAMLAQQTTAPQLTLMFEAGGVGPRLPRMPISVGDSRTFYQGLMATSMADIMETCQRGMVDYTFLGGAQIDRYGNLNSTVIGDYHDPAVRLPGSGGANDLGAFCRKTLIITVHDPRRFVERVDFITTAGYLDGPGAREAAGLPPGTGPHKVITDLAILGFHEKTRQMQVESLHPGVTLEEVLRKNSFEIEAIHPLGTTAPPDARQLKTLREVVDPQGYIIGREKLNESFYHRATEDRIHLSRNQNQQRISPQIHTDETQVLTNPKPTSCGGEERALSRRMPVPFPTKNNVVLILK